jgi:peptidylprolyl isomerase
MVYKIIFLKQHFVKGTYMRQLLIGTSLVIASACLMVSCGGNLKNAKDDSLTEQTTEGTTMTRVKTTSGLEYEIIEKGSGDSPSAGKTVTVHYTGWLNVNGERGTQFDSSLTRGEPFVFVIGKGRVIQGWDEGVMTMKIGEKRRLFIPAKLGYGARGAAGIIPAHADLIFDVELLDIA